MKNYERDPIKYADHHSRLHKIWSCMKYRCNHNKQYAGRGIKVCDEWQLYEGFRDWAKSNGYQDDLTIERIDVNGNYCPSNCKWIPFEEQARNRTTTKWVEYNGVEMSLAEVASLSGVDYKLLHGRLAKGWDLERAISEPTSKRKELREKCEALGVNYKCVYQRIFKLGWTEEKALNTPFLGIGANQSSYV